jgi:uncharacterized protein involved in exopolysaccharide biosynthesis
MKKLCAMVFAAALGAAGCMGTTGPKSYEADAPLAVETSVKAERPDRRTTEIDESNYQDSFRQLQSGVNQDRKALGKAGR